ncbi:MAG: aldo/keto reductase [Anaerolineae bacterium]|nr:aldo/keto reductase [Anaerolineae bacterium]
MEYRQLGSDGPQVPVLGLGAWPIGGGMGHVDERVAINTIRAAIDSGITLLDTAQAYRTSEATVGVALRDGYRDRCFLATKASSDYSREGILSSLEDSLRALDVDYVDLYQIHNWKPEYPIEATMETMARLQEQGKARYIGVSNYGAAQMAQALKTARFGSNQVRYSMFDRQIEVQDVPFCEQEGIGILVHSPLAKGLLTGVYTPAHRFPQDDERSRFPRFQGDAFARYLTVADRLQEIALDGGLNLVQLAIAWALRLPAITCVLVGAKNPSQVQDHAGAAGVVLGDEELARISEILSDAPQD